MLYATCLNHGGFGLSRPGAAAAVGDSRYQESGAPGDKESSDLNSSLTSQEPLPPQKKKQKKNTPKPEEGVSTHGVVR